MKPSYCQILLKILSGLFVTFNLLFYSDDIRSQEMFGITLSDYSGISSTFVNPAFMTGSRVYLDVNFVTENTFFENNLYYAPMIQNVVSNFANGEYNLYDGSFKYGRAYNYFDNKAKKSFVANVRLMGPSIMIQAGKHAIGLTTSVRSFQSGNKIPYEIPIIIYEEIRDERFHLIEFNDHEVNFSGMTWSEIGLNYAYDIYDRYDNKLTIGLGVKALFGIEGAYLSARNVNYIIVDHETVNVINFDADVGYSLPIDSQTNEFRLNPTIKGYGIGGDLGLVYTKKRSTVNYKGEHRICAKPYHDYIYKLGISLLDFGSVTFTHNSELHRFENVNHYWEQFDTVQFISFNRSMRSYSEVFYGNADSSFVNNKIKIGLPTAISLQFDYHLKQNIYLGFVWIHPLQAFQNTIWRPAQLAIIPRIENRYFGLSVPVSLYNYVQPRIGFAVRFLSFTFGTDNLISWFGITDFTGVDIYFSIKINLLKGNCLSTKNGACYNRNFGVNK